MTRRFKALGNTVFKFHSTTGLEAMKINELCFVAKDTKFIVENDVVEAKEEHLSMWVRINVPKHHIEEITNQASSQDNQT